jgi:membrane protein
MMARIWNSLDKNYMSNRLKNFFKEFWDTFKKSFGSFFNDNAIKLSASLSYYTIFSLPPLIIIIVSLVGSLFGREAIQGEIYGQIQGLVGSSAAIQIQETIKNIQLSRDTPLATLIGVVTLIIGATGVFSEIQDSINGIWGIKAKPKRGFLKLLLNRLISFSMIVVMGFLLLVSLLVNTLMDLLSNRLQHYFSNITVSVFFVLNLVLVFAVIASLFTIIFKVLPDGKVNWKDSLKGASFTAFLFMIGKFAIGAYLGSSAISSEYGAAGSIIVILLWVYYSSIILYFGAEFTKVYALYYGSKIIPNNYAVQVVVKEVERTKSPSIA